MAKTLGNEQWLLSVLNKCHNIIKVSLFDVDLISDADTDLLSLIGQHCPRLKSLDYTSSEETLSWTSSPSMATNSKY